MKARPYTPNQHDLDWQQSLSTLDQHDLETSLIKAAKGGMVWHIEALLDFGVNIHCRHEAPLVEAARHNHVDAVKTLLRRGANIDAKNHGMNDSPDPTATDKKYEDQMVEAAALNFALQERCLQTAEILLKNGSNAKAVTDDTYQIIFMSNHLENREFAELAGDMIDHYLKRQDEQRKATILPDDFFDGKTIEDLRQIDPKTNESGIIAAVKANQFNRVMEIALEGDVNVMRLGDFTQRSQLGNKTIDILSARGQLSTAFQQKFWEGCPKKMEYLWKNHIPERYKTEFNFASAHSQINQRQKPVVLKRRRPKP